MCSYPASRNRCSCRHQNLTWPKLTQALMDAKRDHSQQPPGLSSHHYSINFGVPAYFLPLAFSDFSCACCECSNVLAEYSSACLESSCPVK